ncbi:MAG TPA: KGG domain-containing protein [Candidatus Methylomirabilis sp.]
MSREEAGRRGGEATRKSHGSDFYSEIGSKQGKGNNPGNFANRPKEEVRESGRKGGESR